MTASKLLKEGIADWKVAEANRLFVEALLNDLPPETTTDDLVLLVEIKGIAVGERATRRLSVYFHLGNLDEIDLTIATVDFYVADAALAKLQSFDTKWGEEDGLCRRYSSFMSYAVRVIHEDYAAVAAHCCRVLTKKFLHNIHEPIVFRVRAALLLGLYHVRKEDREEAAGFYREGLVWAQQATEEERNRMFCDAFDHVQRSIGEEIDRLATRMATDLNMFEHPNCAPNCAVADGVLSVRGHASLMSEANRTRVLMVPPT